MTSPLQHSFPHQISGDYQDQRYQAQEAQISEQVAKKLPERQYIVVKA
jgi:hypothetical protein